MPPIGYPGNSATKPARAKSGGGFESAIKVASGTGFTGTNGETITLTGTGFGALANPLPSAIDDMTSYGAVNDGDLFPVNADSGAKWVTDNGVLSDEFEFDTTIKIPGRPVSARALGVKSNLQDFKVNPNGPARSATHLYSTHWMRMNEDPFPPTQPDQLLSFKFARYWGKSNGSSTRLSWLLRDDPQMTFSAAAASPAYWSSAPYFSGSGVGEWHRMEVEITPATGTLFNVKAYVDGQKVIDHDGDYSLEGEAVDAWYTRVIGLDPSERAKLTTTMRNWVSDAYEQPTIARIELSNDAVYDTSVVQTRHYQKTLTRSDTEITFEAFYGYLDTAQPVYAHIIKADRSVLSERIN